MTDIVLSIVMLAAVLLLGGAFALWRQTGDVKKPALMVVLAIIAVANILIWTIPTKSGTSPVEQVRAVED